MSLYDTIEVFDLVFKWSPVHLDGSVSMRTLLAQRADDASLCSSFRVHNSLLLVLVVNPILIMAFSRLHVQAILLVVLLLLYMFAHGLLLFLDLDWIVLAEICG